MNWETHPWAGVFPATLCPFHDDESIMEIERIERDALSQ